MTSTAFDLLIVNSSLPRIEARALLESASGQTREWLIAHGDEPADAPVVVRFAELVRRRRAGEPLAYLVGYREFFGRRFAVDSTVLIPRPETELLVQLALERLDAAAPSGRVLDLGTGSGVLAVTIALERPQRRVVATDRSETALAVARANAQALGARSVSFAHGDWFGAVSGEERFALIVSNPPYVAADDPHLTGGDLVHEPRDALTDGNDGLAQIARICFGAADHLLAGAWLLIEHGHDQGAAVRAELARSGRKLVTQITTWRDLAGHERVSGAVRLGLE